MLTFSTLKILKCYLIIRTSNSSNLYIALLLSYTLQKYGNYLWEYGRSTKTQL